MKTMPNPKKYSSWSRLLRLSSWSVAIGSMAILAACGGDSDGGASASTNAGTAALDEAYASEDDLPGCTEKYDGAVALVDEDSTAFLCEDGRWENKGKYYVNIDAINNCTAKREGEVAYIVDEDKSLVCQDGKWVNTSAKTDDKGDEPAEGTSSSNEKSTSSSSKDPEPAEGTSSSSVSPTSSSSISSSSQTPSSSSDGKVDCSALLQEDTGWNWSVPKECRLNPEITYGTMTDSRDKKIYRTVKIGTQTWMAENLNYADSVTTPSLKGESWCYNNVAKNCDVAGRLYTWAAAIDSVKLATDATNPLDCGYGKTCGLSGTVRGICPSGWHLPSQAEWYALFTAVGGSSTAGRVLKSQTGWTAYSGITNEDAFGFSALPAGDRNIDGDFSYDGYLAYFWSSTEYGSGNAYYMYLYYYDDGAYLSDNYKGNGFSVRCLRD